MSKTPRQDLSTMSVKMTCPHHKHSDDDTEGDIVQLRDLGGFKHMCAGCSE